MFGPESPLLFWHGFLIAFALTCAIEVPAYLGAFAALGWVRRDSGPLTRRSAIALVVAVNLITHPMLWSFALRGPDIGALLLAELAGCRSRSCADLRRRPAPRQASRRLG